MLVNAVTTTKIKKKINISKKQNNIKNNKTYHNNKKITKPSSTTITALTTKIYEINPNISLQQDKHK